MYSLRAKVKFQIFTTLEHGNQLQINVHMITIEDTGASLRGIRGILAPRCAGS